MYLNPHKYALVAQLQVYTCDPNLKHIFSKISIYSFIKFPIELNFFGDENYAEL